MRTQNTRARAAAMLCCTAILAVTVSQNASAQETPSTPSAEPEKTDDIIVTGTRIRRTDTTTAAPVTVIDKTAITDRGFISAAQALNQVTSNVPENPVSGGFGDAPGGGQQFPNLFGLGAGRTLTLVNGRRMVTSASGLGDRVVDANIIPTGLIRRVEVVQAGGAAVYGSDAIAGVVNYILQDDFEGVEADAQYGISSRGDYPEFSARLTAGRNFAEGRGNIAVDLEYTKTEPLFNRDRPEWTFKRPAFRNPQNSSQNDGQPPSLEANGRRVFWDNNYNGVIFTPLDEGYPSPASAFLVRRPGAPNTQGLQIAPDGRSVIPYFTGNGLTPGSFPTVPFAAGGDGLDFLDMAALYTGLERKNATLVGHYDITDSIRFSTELLYARTVGRDPLANGVSNSVLGDPDAGSGAIPFTRENPYLTPQMIATLDEASADFQSGGPLFLSKQWADLIPTRESRSTTDVWRGLVALNGDFKAMDRDFYWDLSYSYAKTKGRSRGWGIHTQRFAKATDAVYGSGGRIVCGVNADGDTANDDPSCAPLNIFGQGTYDPAAAAYVSVPTGDDYTNTQSDLLATLGGKLLKLPGGDLGFSIAYEHRRETAKFVPSDAAQLGLTGSGVPTLPTSGRYHTNEFSGEVLVPIVGGDFTLPAVKALEFSGQYRIVDNSIAGKENVWGLGLRWDTGFGITFRGSRSRNFRAPTLDQLFAPSRTELSDIGGYDPCDLLVVNGGSVPEVRRANCLALFTANPGYGSADLAAYNSDNGTNLPPTPQNRLANFQSDASNFAVAQITSGGNPDLRNEISTTTTFGVVIQPRFIPGLTIVADRVEVDLRDGLSAFSSYDFLNTCLDSVSMPSDVCSIVQRDPATGEVISGRTTTYNAGRIRFRGEIYNIEYTFPVGRFFKGADYGTLELAVEATHTSLLEASVTGFDFARVDGTAFDDSAGVQGAPEWQVRFDARYAKGPLRVAYSLNYLPRTHRLAGSSIETTQFPFVSARYQHNVSMQYRIGNYTLRAGVNNLTDTGPAYPTYTYGNILGRQYFVGVNAKF